jgi:hypothetical protein
VFGVEKPLQKGKPGQLATAAAAAAASSKQQWWRRTNNSRNPPCTPHRPPFNHHLSFWYFSQLLSSLCPSQNPVVFKRSLTKKDTFESHFLT